MKTPKEYLKDNEPNLYQYLDGNNDLNKVCQVMEDYKNLPENKQLCTNCGEMVEMISSWEFCPNCYY